MPEIVFTCPKCQAEIEAESSFAGSVAQCPSCSSTVLIPMPGIAPGMRIAGYEIVRRLGAGGMGEVWLANQTAMDRKVALKILSPALTSNPEFVERFLKEVRTAAKLEHPNIVTAFDAGVDGSVYFLAMSFVEGALLDDLLTVDKRIPEKEALRIVRCIGEALRYAWDKFQMLHRDIKPANIMLGTDKVPKLLDMGISKSLSEDNGLTMTGMIVGTPHYMSPEQAKADCPIDCRSDIYSLGATLYHLVTGEVPYDSTSAMAILMKHMSEPFPPPQEKNPDLSDACAVLLEVMMAKKPESRPADWNAVIEDMDLVSAGEFPRTKRPAVGQSVVMQMTNSRELSRRKVLKQPPKAKLTHSGQKPHAGSQGVTGASSQQVGGGGRPGKSKTPVIIAAAAVFVIALAVVFAAVSSSKKAAAEKARAEAFARQKADDEKRLAAEAAKKKAEEVAAAQKAELEKQKADDAARLDKERQEVWDAAAKFAAQALADKANFDTAIANLDNVKASCKGTKFEIMADAEIAKLAKAKKDFDDEKIKKAEEEKRLAADAVKNKTPPDGGRSQAEPEERLSTAQPSASADAGDEAPAKLAVPTADAVKAARLKLRETFKDDFGKKGAEEKLAFSKSLRETAATEKDTAQKYALFAEAVALAADAGSTDEAFAAIDEMCAVFDASAPKEKGQILSAAAKKASKPDEFKALATRCLALVNEAIGDSDPAAASDLLDDCKPLAFKAKDKALSGSLSEKAKEIAALSTELKKLKPSMDKLKESPDDPEANLVVGRYACFSKGDWEKGLPMLVKCSDETLKAAAKLEAEASDPEKTSKAADAW